jgi:hypothetical protein
MPPIMGRVCGWRRPHVRRRQWWVGGEKVVRLVVTDVKALHCVALDRGHHDLSADSLDFVFVFFLRVFHCLHWNLGLCGDGTTGAGECPGVFSCVSIEI